MSYTYSRKKPKSPKKAVELLGRELRRYRGGLIPSSEKAGEEHPLHFAVRQVEAYKLKRRPCSCSQIRSLVYPIALYWYSLLDWSRRKDRQAAIHMRNRLLDMLELLLDSITSDKCRVDPFHHGDILYLTRDKYGWNRKKTT